MVSREVTLLKLYKDLRHYPLGSWEVYKWAYQPWHWNGNLQWWIQNMYQLLQVSILVGNGKVAFRIVYTPSALFILLQTFKEIQVFAGSHTVDAFEWNWEGIWHRFIGISYLFLTDHVILLGLCFIFPFLTNIWVKAIFPFYLTLCK